MTPIDAGGTDGRTPFIDRVEQAYEQRLETINAAIRTLAGVAPGELIIYHEYISRRLSAMYLVQHAQALARVTDTLLAAVQTAEKRPGQMRPLPPPPPGWMTGNALEP